MAETLQNLSDAQMIAEHVARTLLSAAQYPEFPPGNVPDRKSAEGIWKIRNMGTKRNGRRMVRYRDSNRKRKQRKLLHQSEEALGADRVPVGWKIIGRKDNCGKTNFLLR